MKKQYQRFVSFSIVSILLVAFLIFSSKTSPNTCRNGYYYLGEITSNQPVEMNLSCDLRTLKITGDEGMEIQTIVAEDVPLVDDIHPDLVSFVDYSDDSDHSLGEVQVSNDYNFDGYNDLEIIYSYGAGDSQITQKSIFLYSPETRSFVYHKELSSIPNVYPDEILQRISTHIGLGYGAYEEQSYTWHDNSLQIVGKEECTLVDPKGHAILDFNTIDDSSRYRQTVKSFINGKADRTNIKYYPYKSDTYSCSNSPK